MARASTRARAAGGERHHDLARQLLNAEHSRTTIEPLSATVPELTVDDAYAIQRIGREIRTRRGAKVRGRKIGLTSRAMQEQIGVDQPDYGYLLDSMLLPSGASLDGGRFIAPLVEAEIAFILDAPITSADPSAEEVLAATASVAPALEILDSRITDWRIELVDTIADNASCAAVVLGESVAVSSVSIEAVRMELESAASTANGAAADVLGHPANSVAWLARELQAHGEALGAGDVVLSGALSRALPLPRSGVVRSVFSTLGEVSLHVDARESQLLENLL